MDQDVLTFVDFVERLSLDIDRTPPEFSYPNPVLVLVDTVLSVNRKYDAFVVPRIKLIQEQGIASLAQVDQMITDKGAEAFADVWSYRHPQRVEMLQQLVKKFLLLTSEYGLSELETLKRWGAESTAEGALSFGVTGIGFTTYQYLRILCGANTVKPDRHIQRAFIDAVGRSRPLVDIVEVVEKAATRLNVPARQLDYALWRYYSEKAALGT